MKKTLFIALALLTLQVATVRPAAARVLSESGRPLPQKLPAKLPSKSELPMKHSRIDFNESDAVIASPKRSAGKETKETTRTTVVKSRSIVVAPEGDLAEPMAAFDKPTSKAAKAAAPVASTPVPLAAAPVPSLPQKTSVVVETSPREPALPPAYNEPAPFVGPTPRPFVGPVAPAPLVTEEIVVTSESVTAPRDEKASGFLQAIAPDAISFLRAGYLNANYKKFDDRMNNNATSIGLGVARGFETTWGSFEARAAFDAYHAMDQSVTIDNIRMLSVRTELAYWLSHSRVKPGVSLGLGWADYSIRSYRSSSGADEQLVTLRTHAKSRAFSVIPATSLRVELGHGLMIDTQTEFLALLGGDSSNAAQGLGVTVSLGWIY